MVNTFKTKVNLTLFLLSPSISEQNQAAYIDTAAGYFDKTLG